jgi:hypothetical protein
MKRCDGCGNSDRKAFEPFAAFDAHVLRAGYRCLKCSRVMFQ